MTKKPSHPAPPAHLTDGSRRFWRATVAEYALERHHLKLLQAALESWDEMAEAKALIDQEGLVFHDRFGAPRPHPAVSIAQKAREQFGRLMRQLDLEGEPNALYRR